MTHQPPSSPVVDLCVLVSVGLSVCASIHICGCENAQLSVGVCMLLCAFQHLCECLCVIYVYVLIGLDAQENACWCLSVYV